MDSNLNVEIPENQVIYLNFWRKVAFGIGGLPMQLTSSMISFYLSIFLLEIVKASPTVFIIIAVSGRISDAITDIFAGYILQRYSNIKSLIKSLMGISTIFLCISLFFLFYNIDNPSSVVQAIFYTFIIICFQTSMTFYFIPYVSLTMRATNSQEGRDTLTSFRMVFEIFGLLLGAGLFGNIITSYRPSIVACEIANTSNVLIKEQEMGYLLGTSICIFIIIICAYIPIFGVIERDIYKEAYDLNLKFFFTILRFRPYLILMTTFACTAIGMMIIQANMALYIIHVLKMPKNMAQGILVMMSCSILLIPLAHYIIVKFGKKLIYFSGMLSIFPILISLLLIPQHPGEVVFYIIMIYTSYPVMVAFLLPWSMLPDCIDYFVVLHGIRKEGAFYSLFVFFQKFAVGFTVGMTGVVLGLTGYDSSKCIQSKSVEFGLRYLMACGGMLFFCFGMLSLYFYPIDKDKRADIKYKLFNKKNNDSKILIEIGEDPTPKKVPIFEDVLEVLTDSSKEEVA